MPQITGDDAIRFFEDFEGRVPAGSPVNWSYGVEFDPASESQARVIASVLHEKGFATELFRRPASWFLHISEMTVHSVESYVERVTELRALAQQHSGELAMFSASGMEHSG